jgi:hypothetical protein
VKAGFAAYAGTGERGRPIPRYDRCAMNYPILVVIVVILLVFVGVAFWKRMN